MPPWLKNCGIILLLAAPFGLFMFTDGSRLHWPHVAANYFIVMLVYMWERRKQGIEKMPGLLSYMFPKEVWLHRSSINDGVFALMTFVLMATLFNQWIFSPKYYVALANRLSDFIPPAVPGAPVAGWGALALFTVLAVILQEFFYYWFHRLAHTIPALWEFHKVHHSAKVMTPLAVYRLHPVDFWLTGAMRGLGLGVASVIFLHFYPPGEENVLKLMKANALVFVLSVAGGVLHHSHIWLSYGWLERLIISPAQHQVHHSDNPNHYDKNFSAMLSLWDVIFGTLYLTKRESENIVPGLGSETLEAPYSTPWSMLLHPFRANYQMAHKRLTRRAKRPQNNAEGKT